MSVMTTMFLFLDVPNGARANQTRIGVYRPGQFG